MIEFLITFAIYLSGLAYETGYASHYSPHVMAATIEARQGWEQLPQDLSGYAGFVARPHCDEIGDTVWLRAYGEGNYKPYLVTDCAVRDGSDGAMSWMLDNNIPIELDYDSAVKLDAIGGGLKIEMLKE